MTETTTRTGSDRSGTTEGNGTTTRDAEAAASGQELDEASRATLAVDSHLQTNRWRGVVAVSLLMAAAGLLAKRHELLALSATGVVFATYPKLVSSTSPSLAVERSVSNASPTEGDRVEVTLTVRNEGTDTVFDCRVLDGVPPALCVVDEPARRGVVLRPGDEESFTYTIVARHGRHSFEPATVVVRDVSGDREWELTVEAPEDVELDCTSPLSSSPVRPQTLDTVGTVTSRAAGDGIQFAQTREYRRGDPFGQVDWNRYAATGELSTIEFHEEQSASVLVVVDARSSAYRSAPDQTHAVDASVSAAEQLVEAFQRDRNHVGVATLGPNACFVSPGAGREHRLRTRKTLRTHRSLTPTNRADPPLDEQVDRLLERLRDDTQLFVLTPLTDDDVLAALRRVEAHGHATTVVSPDVTGSDTPGERLATVERRTRLTTLRRVGIPVVDWSVDQAFALAVSNAHEVGR